MHKPIIFSIIILMYCSQTIDVTGDYQPSVDLSSQEFQDVFNFISTYSTFCGHQPYKAQKQVVHGYNYQINLQNAAGCIVQVTVYFSKGAYTITSTNTPPCLTDTLTPNTPQDQAGPIATPSTTNILTGGYKVQSNPSGADFESALALALSQGNPYYRSDLVLTEAEVAIGTNFRLTFRTSNGSLSQVVIYVPIGGLPAIPAKPRLPYDDTIRPYELTEPSSYIRALNFITDSYPQMKSYTVTGAELLSLGRAFIPGNQYTIGLQKNSHNTIKYALFRVFFGIYQSTTSITQLAWIDVTNYQVPCLIHYYNDSLGQHPELDGAFLKKVQNSKEMEKEGVSFEFSKGSQKYKVLVYKYGAKIISAII